MLKKEEIKIRAEKKVRVNERIRVPEVFLIDQNGTQQGKVETHEAILRAKAAGLDLVEVSPNAQPPVCRIMDYGKFLFEQSKQKAAQKKKQKQTQVKEIKFRPVTDVGDFNVKVKKIRAFLERGDKVKVSIRFRGREVQFKNIGLELIERLKKDLPEGLIIEQEPKMEGRQISMVIGLGKK